MPPDIIFRPALYLGSMPFEADKLSRAAFVRNKLEVLQKFSFFKPVMLCISTSGVKVCDPDCKTVYMAHALRRISYATCDPSSSKFAFLAREANSETPCQYCHIFATETQYQAEELNAIIGDAFKLAYAKQRLPQQQQGSTDIQLPALSSLHPVGLLLPLAPEQTLEESATPPLQIPPPPSTSPPSPPLFSANSPPLTLHERGEGERQGEEPHCNGSPCRVSSHLRRHWLQEARQDEGGNEAAVAGVIGQGNVTARQRAFSDPRAPCPLLLQHQQRNQHLQQNPLRRHQQPARHSVAFFDASSPASPKFSALHSPPPQTPSSPLPISPISIKDKYRAIFDLPLGDHSLTTIAASPVVALKTHLDSLANESKKPLTKQTPHHKKSESSFSSTSNAVVSRFRLRQSGSSGGGSGGKKRQLERPLSQIICQLDSALLLNNSPSFSVQPRSEERLSGVAPSNSHSNVTEDENNPESDDIMGIPRDIIQCLDDLENPPVPPLRVHSLRRGFGATSRHSSSETSPHKSGGRVPLQSLSESSGAEILDLEAESPKDGGSANKREVEEEDAGDLEFAILEAAAAAEAETEAEELAAVIATSQHDQKLADVCPVPPFDGPVTAWQSTTAEGTGGGEMLGPCPLHAGLESSPSSLHNGSSDNQQSQPLATINGGCRGWLNCFRPTPTPSRQPHQSGRWTGETPTPTATPTPTPTPAPLLPFQHPTPPWFQAYLPREVALELLTHEETGSFLVRDSVTQPGCWALSVRVPTNVNCVGITHYLIQRSKHGVKLKGLDKEWPSLEALITHLTVMPEMLPCPLRLPPAAHSGGVGSNHHQASNPTFTEEEEGEGEGATGALGMVEKGYEEYQRLSDFSSMLADMQPASAVPHLFR